MKQLMNTQMNRTLVRGLLGAALVLVSTQAMMADDDDTSRQFLPNPSVSASTVPTNGDVNPYGVAFVPEGFPSGGTISPGDILVSNYNNGANLQGTGTTIVRIQANGQTSLFYQEVPGPLQGLSTGLSVLKAGLVIVASMPTVDGTSATIQPGSILVLNSSGVPVADFSDPVMIQGPWDTTVSEKGNSVQIFISNALTGTISRLDCTLGSHGQPLFLQNKVQIGSGYMHRGDPAALVVAPTGLVYDATKDVLYVASADDNEVFALPHAGTTSKDEGTGRIVYNDQTHLHGPLGMAMTPNGHLIVANADVINGDVNQPSEIVEFTITGKFVGQLSVDKAQGGSFGLAVSTVNNVSRLAAVDDNTATLTIWTLPQE